MADSPAAKRVDWRKYVTFACNSRILRFIHVPGALAGDPSISGEPSMTIKRALTGTLVTAMFLTLAPVSGTFAEELRVPVGSQADRGQQNVPRTGTTQASVRASWGQPASVEGPVGQPPISQWNYGNFVVYFENDRVIHSVLTPQR